MLQNLKRLNTLQKKITQKQAFLLSNPNDIRYYLNFIDLVPEEREAFLLVTNSHSYLIHASFTPIPDKLEQYFQSESQPQISPFTNCSLNSVKKHISKILKKDHFQTLYLDHTSLFVNEYLSLKNKFDFKLKKIDRNLIWQQRMIKDDSEKKQILKACEISNQVFQSVKKKIQTGITEKNIADLLEHEIKRKGGESTSFPTIVGFGAHGALPHYQPKNYTLEKETAILIDFGAKFQGYCADMSRSFWFGKKPPKEYLKIKKVVDQAYHSTLNYLKNSFLNSNKQEIIDLQKEKSIKEKNFRALDLDNIARTHITLAGFGKEYIHTTGHGLGLDIHEPPSLSWKNDQKIQANMTFTLEPGIYLRGKFGYRYENTIIVDQNSENQINIIEATKK